jgi:hypothetical protein
MSTETMTKAPVAPIDPRNAEHVAALQAELVRVFPAAANHLRPVTGVNSVNAWGEGARRGVWLALAQHAWTDESWGWQSEVTNREREAAAKYGDTRYEPCALGGFFIRDTRSIGD